MQREEEEDIAAPLRNDAPAACACPTLVSRAAKLRGVRCQEIFLLAYRRAEEEEVFSRAVFVRFLASQRKKDLIPFVVREYCERVEKLSNDVVPEAQGFCLGCTFNTRLWEGILFSYGMIHPEVDDEFLRQSAKKKVGCSLLSPQEEDLLETEELCRDLEEIGTFDMDDENWMDLMRREDQI